MTENNRHPAADLPPLSPTPRSTVKRGAHRSTADRATLYAVLDAGLICHLSTVVDGSPVVLPTGYGRDGDTLYLHGSTGARSLRAAMTGMEVCVAVTLVDGVVYARSVFHHSMNYRSAVIHGTATQITDPDAKLHGLRVLTEHMAPGSWDHARLPTTKELAATAVLTLDLAEAAVKTRAGGPGDDEEDIVANVAWAGVLPLRRVWGEPESDSDLDQPAHITARATAAVR
ncbi:nitroimidazol reductase NimA-like FMN-containing flavoprotein (pyridoxamine 5'-phosphate oxidase superfamily) [Actinokineospora baliensis]|uniref:pyridoxamine 5'-phosphate oxidase family protein n=1 Tax=Actinokineospora baliensis TaxID=547056 RepID=UPI003557A4E4|nr:nitroimidazol reductase NimA-like FMN-containing flavoprotein (pyridoxamine 5'-phosphate oxidase superfamily) [Actinokineospora baliensis]